MKIVKFLSVLPLIYCVQVRVAEVKTEPVSQQQVKVPFFVRSMSQDALFLYDLYLIKAEGDESAFLGLVESNEKGLLVDECKDILKKNDEYLDLIGKRIDKVFYANLNLTKGFLAGAATLGGLFGIYKSSQMLQDMYWRKRRMRYELEDMVFAKILQMEEEKREFAAPELPSFFPLRFKGTEYEQKEKEGMEYLKTLKIPERYGEGEYAVGKKYNLVDAKPLDEYIRDGLGATVLSTFLYAGGAHNLIQYLGAVYRSYQQKKLEHEQLVKYKEIGKRMLQALEKIRTAE